MFGASPQEIIGNDDGYSVERSFAGRYELPSGGFPGGHAERARLQRKVGRKNPPLRQRSSLQLSKIPMERFLDHPVISDSPRSLIRLRNFCKIDEPGDVEYL